MAEDTPTISGFQPDILPGKEESSVERIPGITEKKSLEPPKDSSAMKTIEVNDDMPLTIFQESFRIPYGVECLELKPFWNENISNVQGLTQEMDEWIETEMNRRSFRNTLSSYKELIQEAKKDMDLSPNIHPLANIKRLHSYFKTVNKKFVNPKK